MVLPGDRDPIVLVLGPPTTGQISYAADGTKFAPVETTNGWGIFDRSGPTSSKPDLIEILDGNGDLDRPIYRGPLQLGPSDPDV